jgi:hypothetical protein
MGEDEIETDQPSWIPGNASVGCFKMQNSALGEEEDQSAVAFAFGKKSGTLNLVNSNVALQIEDRLRREPN